MPYPPLPSPPFAFSPRSNRRFAPPAHHPFLSGHGHSSRQCDVASRDIAFSGTAAKKLQTSRAAWPVGACSPEIGCHCLFLSRCMPKSKKVRPTPCPHREGGGNKAEFRSAVSHAPAFRATFSHGESKKRRKEQGRAPWGGGGYFPNPRVESCVMRRHTLAAHETDARQGPTKTMGTFLPTT